MVNARVHLDAYNSPNSPAGAIVGLVVNTIECEHSSSSSSSNSALRAVMSVVPEVGGLPNRTFDIKHQIPSSSSFSSVPVPVGRGRGIAFLLQNFASVLECEDHMREGYATHFQASP